MKYIVIKRFKKQALCGNVNIPAQTECNVKNGCIAYDGKPICVTTSENAHQYFARDDDRCGMERGHLTQEIQNRLAKNDKNHQARWDKVWSDKIAQKYKRKEYDDHWLWNHDFFQASIEDLKHILEVVKSV